MILDEIELLKLNTLIYTSNIFLTHMFAQTQL